MTRKPDVEDVDFDDTELIQALKNHGLGRRGLLKALGIGAGVATLGGTAAARPGRRPPDDVGRPRGNAQIDPYYGYSSPEDQDLSHASEHLRPDRTVELHIGTGPIPFHFDPMGIHIEVGDVVRFDIHSPDHTITAYHLGHGRQQRVPDDAKPFSSPIITPGGFWLYEFEYPGIYDINCAPHEFFAMVMRIVVGDPESDAFDAEFSDAGRPPTSKEAQSQLPGVDEWPLPTAADVFATDAMSVENIVDNGPVTRFDVAQDF